MGKMHNVEICAAFQHVGAAVPMCTWRQRPKFTCLTGFACQLFVV